LDEGRSGVLFRVVALGVLMGSWCPGCVTGSCVPGCSLTRFLQSLDGGSKGSIEKMYLLSRVAPKMRWLLSNVLERKVVAQQRAAERLVGVRRARLRKGWLASGGFCVERAGQNAKGSLWNFTLHFFTLIL
jgi:DNA-binding protein Fis